MVGREAQDALAQPNWNTATTTPYAAATDSRLRTTALAAIAVPALVPGAAEKAVASWTAMPSPRTGAQVMPQARTCAADRVGQPTKTASPGDVLLAEQALNDTRLRLAEARRDLWRAVADLEGLMQLDVGEELCPLPISGANPAEPVPPAPARPGG